MLNVSSMSSRLHRKSAGDEHMLLSSKYANVPVACRMHTLFSYYMYTIVLCVIAMIAKAKLTMLLSAFNLTMMKEKYMYCC